MGVASSSLRVTFGAWSCSRSAQETKASRYPNVFTFYLQDATAQDRLISDEIVVTHLIGKWSLHLFITFFIFSLKYCTIDFDNRTLIIRSNVHFVVLIRLETKTFSIISETRYRCQQVALSVKSRKKRASLLFYN